MNEQQRSALRQLGISVRSVELDDSLVLDVPKGIARNKARRCWQLRFARDGEMMGPFNFTDGTYGDAAASLDAAIEELIKQKPTKKGGSSTGVSGKVPPIRLTPRLTLNWRMHRNNRTVVAQIYSPILKKANVIYIGGMKAMLNPTSLEISRLAEALIMNERVKREDQNPFRSVSRHEVEAVRQVAENILTSKTVVDFVARGDELAA